MKAEIEAKFLAVNHNEMRRRLAQLGAKQVAKMQLMKRKNFDFPDNRLDKVNGWVRVRDEGDKVTLAYKQLDHRGVDGTKEVSMTVDSFEAACQFLESIGLEQKSYQETKRESWRLGDVEIELDEWPWIKPFLEIEAQDEATLKAVAEKLGLDWKDALHGSVEIAYQAEYDVTEEEIDSWPTITFVDTPADIAAKKRS